MDAPEPGAAPLEADNDDDSAIEFDLSSETESLNSLVAKFRFENGRRYHAFQAGRYAFPNDEEELDRMDLENEIFLMLLDGKLHHAPVKGPQRILDLGTGTGIWAIDIADLYHSASVVGTDLSPVQPTDVPPNLQFQIDDFEQDWTFQRDSFDLIHWRLLLASVSDYPKLFQQAFQHTKPGGYLEIHDIDPGQYCDDGTLAKDSSSVRWGELFYEGCERAGRPIPPIESYKLMMERAGFIDIKEQILKRPSNIWPKDGMLKHIGRYTLANHLYGLHGFTIGLFTRALKWTPAEVEVLVAQCRQEWKNRALHGYQKVLVLYGRKPPAETEL